MAIYLYNSLTRKKEEFIPLKEKEINFYGCGPTVYNYFHVGNARTFMMYDVLRRYFEFCDYKVNFVVNITDIDDRIIEQANKEKIDYQTVSEKYFQAYQEDCQQFGIRPAKVQPRATEHLSEIVRMISDLIRLGYAYPVNGDVYFEVDRFRPYGKLSGKNIDELRSGARVEVAEMKKNPLDFALWKTAKPGEPSWESPWGRGRPGWHIECSAMSMKYLGETFDIHAGANDLIFPHHENEIAQSESVTGKPFVRYWIHLGFLNFEGEKMSKSIGNFYTLREILKKIRPEALRLFFLQSHYRAPIDFTLDALEAAEKGYQRLENTVDELGIKIKITGETDSENPVFGSRQVREAREKFIAAMEDDLNTPQAVAALFDFTRQLNSYLNSGISLNRGVLEEAKDLYQVLGHQIFGILPSPGISKEDDQDLHEKIEALIQLRNQHRKNRDWKMADKIRKEIEDRYHVLLKDTAEGTTWKPL